MEKKEVGRLFSEVHSIEVLEILYSDKVMSSREILGESDYREDHQLLLNRDIRTLEGEGLIEKTEDKVLVENSEYRLTPSGYRFVEDVFGEDEETDTAEAILTGGDY